MILNKTLCNFNLLKFNFFNNKKSNLFKNDTLVCKKIAPMCKKNAPLCKKNAPLCKINAPLCKKNAPPVLGYSKYLLVLDLI